MNFLIVTPNVSLTSPDAQGVHVIEIANSLAELGHDVTVFASLSHELGYSEDSIRILTTISSGGLFSTIQREIKLIRDLYHARTHKTKVVIYIRHYLLCIFPAIFGRLLRIPVIIEVNGMYLEDREVSRAYPEIILNYPVILQFTEFLLRQIINLGFALSNGVIVVSLGLIEYLNTQHKVSINKIKHCPNGVNISNFEFLDGIQCREQLKLDLDKKYLGFIGSLTPWQGIDCVIRAFASKRKEYPDLRLLIVGSGEIEADLKKLVDELRLSSNVFLLGPVSHSKARLYTGAVDFTVAPYTLKYGQVMAGSGIKMLESLAAGRPIITSRLPGHEFIEYENLGFLADPDNVEDWIFVINKAFGINASDYLDMSARARNYAESRLSWTNTARCITSFAEIFLSD